MTKKASYITLGCKLNYAETSTYERNFIKEGYESVPWTEKADLYVINTCSVTEHADRKSRNIIRKIHRTAPEATVIVTGCYAQPGFRGGREEFAGKDHTRIHRGTRVSAAGPFRQ